VVRAALAVCLEPRRSADEIDGLTEAGLFGPASPFRDRPPPLGAPHLRSLDAILLAAGQLAAGQLATGQLATGQLVGAEAMIACDRRLIEACEAVGLRTRSPGRGGAALGG
jgi:hypothetical protein